MIIRSIVVCDAECDTDHRFFTTNVRTQRNWKAKTNVSKNVHKRPARPNVEALGGKAVKMELSKNVHSKLKGLFSQRESIHGTCRGKSR